MTWDKKQTPTEDIASAYSKQTANKIIKKRFVTYEDDNNSLKKRSINIISTKIDL